MTSIRPDDRPVLILGAGVNGISVARELLLNGLGVTVVDTADIAFGATSKSSRLIHGGLRYLEYGDFALVRESLRERERLLRAAPQFVTPLRLHIPVRQRLGGLIASGLRFAGLQKWPGLGQLASWSGSGPRGLVTVESGLRFYDFLAGETSLPPRGTARVGVDGPAVDPARFGWLCSYSDCQMLYPERYVVALVRDCRAISAETGIPFDLLTYHRATRSERRVEIAPMAVDGPSTAAGATPLRVLEPACIVNASGAWGDLTLGELPAPSPRLLGGTKGSHIVTSQRRLREALRGDAIYAEAADGRLVFILPYGDAVMIGTTDDRFAGRPEDVYATDDDVNYLVRMVNEVFPQVLLSAVDVESHCCGVRPLPYVPQGSTTAIPRGHWIASTTVDGLPIHTLVGGKLTTCRALGEETARLIVESRRATAGEKGSWNVFVTRTEERPVPGSADFPNSPQGLATLIESIVRETGWTAATAEDVIALMGTLAMEALRGSADTGDRRLLDGTPYPRSLARWMIDHEECRTFSDLVERRLMLALDPRTTRQTIEDLAETWAEARGPVDLAPVLERLRRLYGRKWA